MNFKEALDSGLVSGGKRVWICDYRFNDVAEKPIRHVLPTLVEVFSNSHLPANKRVYYSDYHFRPIGKNGQPRTQIIAPYDNTGYRSSKGVPVKVFETKEECIAYYQEQCTFILKEIEDERAQILSTLDCLKLEVQRESLSATTI